jgi:hypothetical protein
VQWIPALSQISVQEPRGIVLAPDEEWHTGIQRIFAAWAYICTYFVGSRWSRSPALEFLLEEFHSLLSAVVVCIGEIRGVVHQLKAGPIPDSTVAPL